ncbi:MULTISPECIES: LPXTG cell wall anchor domain-containing protein [Kitasatospora]|nr:MULTISPECIES: LPXTG cell wall anchor domain-containing protein [Kitasatospora]
MAAGAGGSSRDLNPAEVAVGAALIAGAGYLVVRRRRRSRR